MRTIILGLALTVASGPAAGAAVAGEGPQDRCPPAQPRHTASVAAVRSCSNETELRCGCRVEP